MQQAQSRQRSLRWIGRGALALLAGLVALGVQAAVRPPGGGWGGSLGDLKSSPAGGDARR